MQVVAGLLQPRPEHLGTRELRVTERGDREVRQKELFNVLLVDFGHLHDDGRQKRAEGLAGVAHVVDGGRRQDAIVHALSKAAAQRLDPWHSPRAPRQDVLARRATRSGL